jgi:hypothetical protein
VVSTIDVFHFLKLILSQYLAVEISYLKHIPILDKALFVAHLTLEQIPLKALFYIRYHLFLLYAHVSQDFHVGVVHRTLRIIDNTEIKH